jgi:hypothetical protein
MGIFGSVQDASVTGGGVYFLPGKYKVTITGCKVQTSKRNAHTYAIVECEIVESTNAERPSGSRASQVIDLGNVMGPVNVKAFVAALSGIADPAAADVNGQIEAVWSEALGRRVNVEAVCEVVFSEGGPAEGTILDLEVAEITTRGTGKPFNKHFWSPLT